VGEVRGREEVAPGVCRSEKHKHLRENPREGKKTPKKTIQKVSGKNAHGELWKRKRRKVGRSSERKKEKTRGMGEGEETTEKERSIQRKKEAEKEKVEKQKGPYIKKRKAHIQTKTHKKALGGRSKKGGKTEVCKRKNPGDSKGK